MRPWLMTLPKTRWSVPTSHPLRFQGCQSSACPSFLHPHFSILDIVLYDIEDFLCTVNAYVLELYVKELDHEKDIVLPSDDDGAFVVWGADFEADAIVREEYEFGGVPTFF